MRSLLAVCGRVSDVPSAACAGANDGVNPWLGLMPYMGVPPAALLPQAPARCGAYEPAEADERPAAREESARESRRAGSARSASFGNDCTLPAKKRGRGAASRMGSTCTSGAVPKRARPAPGAQAC